MEIPSRLSCPRYDSARSGLPSAAKDESGGKNHAASVQQLCRAIGCEIASDPDQAPCAYPGAWLRICVCLPLLKARSIRLSCVPFALRVTVPVSRVDPAICVAAPVRATSFTGAPPVRAANAETAKATACGSRGACCAASEGATSRIQTKSDAGRETRIGNLRTLKVFHKRWVACTPVRCHYTLANTQRSVF